VTQDSLLDIIFIPPLCVQTTWACGPKFNHAPLCSGCVTIVGVVGKHNAEPGIAPLRGARYGGARLQISKKITQH
jgi:hypothetical protein